MLSKPATMLLGLIYEKPLNAYEIIKHLNYMNVKWWFNIADSTVYSTLKTLEKKEYIIGTAEKVGNMPDRTVYNLSEKGKDEFISTLKASILQFNYDTNIFSIAAFFLNTFTPEEQQKLLQERLTVLQKYRTGIGSIMIGRGLIGNPNLVNEIKGGKKLTKKMLEAYHDRLYNDFEKIMKADKHLLFKMKEMWTYMSLNFDDSHKCAKLIRKAQNLYKYNLAVYEIFEKYELK